MSSAVAILPVCTQDNSMGQRSSIWSLLPLPSLARFSGLAHSCGWSLSCNWHPRIITSKTRSISKCHSVLSGAGQYLPCFCYCLPILVSWWDRDSVLLVGNLDLPCLPNY